MTQLDARTPERLRVAGMACLAGGLGWLIVAAIPSTVDLHEQTTFVAIEVAWIVVHILLLVGLLGLGRAIDGWLGRIGVGAAVLARIVFLAAEVLALAEGKEQDTLLPIAAVVTALSMLLAGIAVLRSGRWSGWQRLIPLAVGGYPFLFMFPFIAMGPEPPLLGIAGWGIPWALLGLALYGHHMRAGVSPQRTRS